MLEASLYISEHLPDGASGLWAVVNCATWVALGELEWIPFAVLRKSIDINLLGMAPQRHTRTHSALHTYMICDIIIEGCVADARVV